MEPSRDSLLRTAEALARSGQIPQAVEAFNEALRLDPECSDAVFWLSVLYRSLGKARESLQFGKQAARMRPTDSNAFSSLGLTLIAVRDYPGATTSFRKAIELNSSVPQNHHQLGLALQIQGLDKEAVPAFRNATRLAPKAVESWLGLAQSLMAQHDFEGSKDAARRAVEAGPDSPLAHLTLAGGLIEENRTAEAEAHVQRAIELDPRDSTAHAMLGVRHQSMGRMEDARNSFLKSIEVQPKQGFAYSALVRIRKVTEADQARIEAMEALSKDPTINLRGRSYLFYGLGKAHEDLGRYEEAMARFDEANRLAYKLKFGDRKPDLGEYRDRIDWSIRTFTPDFLKRHRSVGSDSSKPIFIVGMMRSGTTLVEQILSSHPDVEATGEQRFWMARGHEPIQKGSAKLNDGRLRELSTEYLAVLDSIAPDAPRATDKMPDNFLVLGLIHLAFPNARVIHTRRNAADTAISIYTTPNPAPLEWTHDKRTIVSTYRLYEKLMAHWSAVIPEDRLLTVRYEELITDKESITRQMVEFCGLSWNDACLRPEDNERSVITPSVWQVRQPVYTSSMERWRRYEPWLGAFRELL